MALPISRRTFVKGSALASTGAALALGSAAGGAPAPNDVLLKGKLADMEVSRLLLGGNLLTHYTHSRDLRYVYNLTAHYNSPEKILETLAVAEEQGINTLVIHTVDSALKVLQEHRRRGGKMQWIICSTTAIEPGLVKYGEHVMKMVDDGVDSIYIWGVHADRMTSPEGIDLLGKAVDMVKANGVPCGIGAHRLEVIRQCEANKVRGDYYIKTLHHHKYPTAPKAGEAGDNISEIPGYWCGLPDETVELMKTVEKPWIAFKVMAAGAIPPEDAFRYAFQSGADFILAGMFDFEIAPDARIAEKTFAEAKDRPRPWLA
ncbi:MAG: twin-arginine translocation signal domain-containing protein [Thermoguttaceae bacterium]|jgi:hypothetical protein|nr:twin-arginine translocation signal domain-containing protein [Thermoguttaceae bacterium]